MSTNDTIPDVSGVYTPTQRAAVRLVEDAMQDFRREFVRLIGELEERLCTLVCEIVMDAEQRAHNERKLSD